ncbi:MAG: MutS2/Smr-associated SH3 domain-containing protein [Flavobacteriales bacterium]
MQLDPQSKKDLEFDAICELLSKFCKSNKAKDLALNLKLFSDVASLKTEFRLLQEIQSIHQAQDLNLPHPNSEDIDGALQLLRIENGVLILDELVKIYALCLGTKELIRFSVDNKFQAPLIFDACSHIDSIDEVLAMIKNVLNEKELGIRDDASKELKEVRNQMRSNEKALNKNFEKALRNTKNDGFLADTEETHLDNRRLLTVVSTYKKRVKGRIVGISSKGVVTYIEPEANIQINRNQEQLRIQERHELFLILEKITMKLRSQSNNLRAFQRLLVRFDLYNAKVRFADLYQGIIPKINTDKKMYWEQAVHPLLQIKNSELGLNTIGQKIELDKDTRFLVISGPNAGGKSITLKTIGLVQMMFQSGLYVPLHPNSQCCWFQSIYSDIGDNQSIENQLSTYSYRIKRMKFFLKSANMDTLLLLDEFGSGSDPELGGALAEVFYEQLYQRNTFAVITTHYTNIKILTAQLPQAVNACMLFDTKELRPLYELSVGQPGSSFTFEVAQHNGITKELLEKARLKVADSKVKIDELTVELQKEKSRFKKINHEQNQAKSAARAIYSEYEDKLENLSQKQYSQIRYFEQQNKFVNMGRKIYDLIGKFMKHKTNKALNESVNKIVGIEKSKVLTSENPVVFDKKLKVPEIDTTQKKKIKKAEESIIAQKDAEVTPTVKMKSLKVGDRVRIKKQNKIGQITEIKGKMVSVIIGNFTFNTKITELEPEK